MRQHTLNRRRFVQLASAGLAMGGVALLQACAPAATQMRRLLPPPRTPRPLRNRLRLQPPHRRPLRGRRDTPRSRRRRPTTAPAAGPTIVTASTGSRTVQLPNRFPVAGIKPDLPSAENGLIDAAFTNFPANPIRSVQNTPGNGGEVNVTTWTTSAAPTPLDSNSLWQAVNKELGVDLKINVQPQADYATVKLPTLIAGGDLPDILYIATNSVIPQLPAFLKSKCADLTPYLSGDAVKEYPNLANFPAISWKQVIYNNAIYGVPVPYPLYLWVHWVHQNLLDDDGLQRPKMPPSTNSSACTSTNPTRTCGARRREQRRHGHHQRVDHAAFSGCRISGDWTTRPASSPLPSRRTSSAPRSATRKSCGTRAPSIKTRCNTTWSARATTSPRAASPSASTVSRPPPPSSTTTPRRSTRPASRASSRPSPLRTVASPRTGPTAASSATA